MSDIPATQPEMAKEDQQPDQQSSVDMDELLSPTPPPTPTSPELSGTISTTDILASVLSEILVPGDLYACDCALSDQHMQELSQNWILKEINERKEALVDTNLTFHRKEVRLRKSTTTVLNAPGSHGI